MKKLVFSLVAVFTLTVATSAQAGIEFGIEAGMNLSKVSLKNINSNFSPENRFGFYVGPKVNFSVLGIGGDAAILYSQKRLNLDDDYSRMLRSLEIPINLRYTLGLGKIIAIYAATGPQFGFNIGKTQWKHVFDGGDTTFKRQNMNVSWNIGAGVKLLKHLEVGLSYNIALTKYAKVLNIVGGSEASEFAKNPDNYNFKTNTFQIQVAYLF